MKVLYRISDGGNAKIRPEYFTKRGVFLHFLKTFAGHDIHVFADNVSDDTYAFLCSHLDASKISRISLGNGRSFLYAASYAVLHFAPEEKVYFAEDDYLYTAEAPAILEEGLGIADYVSGYDHPDKYMNHSEGGPNPFIAEGGEVTRVLLTKHRHWKITNSCCMTFGTHVKILKADLPIFTHFCSGGHPHDFHIFVNLKERNKRKLISCIPAVSTHGESALLSPFVDWEQEFKRTL